MPVSSITYSIPYIIFLLYLILLSLLEFRTINNGQEITKIRYLLILGFLFFFGLRGFVFTDWMLYYSIFDKLPTLWEGGFDTLKTVSETFESDLEIGKSGYEFGFIFSTFLFKSLIPDYFSWVFLNVIIDVWLLDIFIRRYSPYYVLSFIFFFAIGGLNIECNLLRNIKSILLFLVSLKYLQDRKILPYMLLNGLGLLFHSSALIFIPLYFILHKQCPKWLMWGLFIVGNLLFLLKISYLQPLMLSFADLIGGRLGVQIKIYFALDYYSQPYGISLGYIERVLTFLLLIFFKEKLIELGKHNVLIINSYILYFIIFFFFSEVLIAVERLTLLFVFSYWIIYPSLYYIVRDKMFKGLVFSILVIFCLLKTTLTSSNVLSRYDNLLFGIEDFETRRMIHDNNVDEFMSKSENNE